MKSSIKTFYHGALDNCMFMKLALHSGQGPGTSKKLLQKQHIFLCMIKYCMLYPFLSHESNTVLGRVVSNKDSNLSTKHYPTSLHGHIIRALHWILYLIISLLSLPQPQQMSTKRNTRFVKKKIAKMHNCIFSEIQAAEWIIYSDPILLMAQDLNYFLNKSFKVI